MAPKKEPGKGTVREFFKKRHDKTKRFSKARSLVQGVKTGVRAFKKVNPEVDLKTRAKIGVAEGKHRIKIGRLDKKVKRLQKKTLKTSYDKDPEKWQKRADKQNRASNKRLNLIQQKSKT